MKPPRRNILSMLDNAVRWTGIPARVADQMSDVPTVDRKHRPLRWSPIWLIACSSVLFILSMIWPSVLMSSLGTLVAAMAPSIHFNGPLGKPALEDDEREAALRKDPSWSASDCSPLSTASANSWSWACQFCRIGNSRSCLCRLVRLHAESDLVRVFTDALCELEDAASAERMIAMA